MKTLVALLIVATVGFAACGGDDDDGGSVNITPAGTKDASITPTPAGTDDGNGGGGPPAPPDPQIKEELTETARGELEAVIEPGGSYEIDTEALAIESGNAAPCDNFQFGFAWQVTDPYPPDGVSLSWQIEREGSLIEVASRADGQQALGCTGLVATNDGGSTITVAIKYAIGGILP